MESDWRKDAGEKARRIWYWWTPIVTQGTIARDFPYNQTAPALRLVAPLLCQQVSSCAVERVFSQLLNIRQTCGDNMHEDMWEIRMFAQCNGGFTSSLFTKIYEHEE